VLVVAMRVDLPEHGQLRKIETLHMAWTYPVVVDAIFDPPGNEVSPHLLSLFEIELAGPQKPEQIDLIPLRVQFPSVVLSDEESELLESSQMFFGAVAGKSMWC
jgi:hypothetical protein